MGILFVGLYDLVIDKNNKNIVFNNENIEIISSYNFTEIFILDHNGKVGDTINEKLYDSKLSYIYEYLKEETKAKVTLSYCPYEGQNFSLVTTIIREMNFNRSECYFFKGSLSDKRAAYLSKINYIDNKKDENYI